MCDLLSKKVCLAQDMADISGDVQVVTRNAVNSYSIVPLKRAGSEEIVTAIGTSQSELHPWQRDQLVAMAGAGVTKQDVVEAAYALGYRAATKAAKAETVGQLYGVIQTIKEGLPTPDWRFGLANMRKLIGHIRSARDEKVVKGVTYIRQRVRSQIVEGALVVRDGRPVYEWVVKGSPEDRTTKC